MTPSNKVRVGATPHPKYATWDEHREAIRREAANARQKRLAARADRIAERRQRVARTN